MDGEKRRRLTAEERREKILEAALDVFSERGFAAATTRELAARAGITEAIIYRHFRSKEDVLRGVMERYSFLPHLRQIAALDTGRPLREQLIGLGLEWRRFVHEQRSLVRLMLGEMARNPDIAQILREAMGRENAAIVEQMLRPHAAGSVPAERITAAARLFFPSLLAHFVFEERLGMVIDPEADARLEATVDVLLAALRAA